MHPWPALLPCMRHIGNGMLDGFAKSLIDRVAIEGATEISCSAFGKAMVAKM